MKQRIVQNTLRKHRELKCLKLAEYTQEVLGETERKSSFHLS